MTKNARVYGWNSLNVSLIEQVVFVRVKKKEMYTEISSAVSQKHVEQHLLSALTVMQI